MSFPFFSSLLWWGLCICVSVCLCVLGGGWGLCICVSVCLCVLEVGGWSEIRAIAKCVRKYAGVSIQCFLSNSVRVYNF